MTSNARPPNPKAAALLCGVLAFIVVIVMFTNALPQGWGGWYRLNQSGKPAEARMDGCFHQGKRMMTRFDYTVAGTTYEGTGMGCAAGLASIAIVYLPSDPSVSALKADQDKVAWAPWLLIGLTGLSAGAAFFLARRKAAAM